MANGMKFSRSDNEIARRLLASTPGAKIIDPRRAEVPQITVQAIGAWAVKGITPKDARGVAQMPLVMMAFDVGTPRARANALDVNSARQFAAGLISTCDELEGKTPAPAENSVNPIPENAEPGQPASTSEPTEPKETPCKSVS